MHMDVWQYEEFGRQVAHIVEAVFFLSMALLAAGAFARAVASRKRRY